MSPWKEWSSEVRVRLEGTVTLDHWNCRRMNTDRKWNGKTPVEELRLRKSIKQNGLAGWVYEVNSGTDGAAGVSLRES